MVLQTQMKNVRRPVFRAEAEDSIYNFITGDRVTIRTVSGEDLAFIPDSEFPDDTGHRSITRFVYVDQAGGIRLYRDFASALRGSQDGATQLNLLDETRLDADTGPDGASEVDNTYQLVEMREPNSLVTLVGAAWARLQTTNSSQNARG